MELTPRIIAFILESTEKDIMFLLSNETADEMVNYLFDKGIKIGDDFEETTESEIMDVLDEHDVIMVSKLDGNIFFECAFGINNLKTYEQDKDWTLLVEEELFMNGLLTAKEVVERLGDASEIDTFEVDEYETNCELEEECDCCNCEEAFCDAREEEYEPIRSRRTSSKVMFFDEYADYKFSPLCDECDELEDGFVNEYMEELLEDTLMLLSSEEECSYCVLQESLDDAFKCGIEFARREIRDSLSESLGE